jgi:hypothetical protein
MEDIYKYYCLECALNGVTEHASIVSIVLAWKRQVDRDFIQECLSCGKEAHCIVVHSVNPED